jgi:hypothetical protein
MNFEQVIEKLRNNEPFHLSRWGDGEFLCMLGKEGKNCDGHRYSDRLKHSLIGTWEAYQNEDEPNPENMYHMVQPHAIRTVEGIERFLNGKQFDSSDLFVKASQNGELGKLFDILNDENKYVILVAPLRFYDWDSDKYCKIDEHIVIPDKNCFDEVDSVYHDILKVVEEGWENIVILYCASMMTNILIEDFSGDNITQIDLGSVLEPYIGHANRKYHTEIIERLK